MQICKAFTLAEVLITLGIIGVVASMTMPSLIQSHRRQVVEARLQKFYSTINQAITMSEGDNGNKADWVSADTDDFFNRYLRNYLSYVKYDNKRVEGGNDFRVVYLPDGSAFLIDIWVGFDSDGNQTFKTNGGHFIFCPNSKDCIDGVDYAKWGKKQFVFAFWPNESDTQFKYHKNRGVEPYMAHWNGEEESLYTDSSYGCSRESAKHFYCTAIIQHNGWKIPKDYPYGF